MKKKIIIAGFPGVGKSEAARRLPGIVIDHESSDFHWIGKEKHPEWPSNYQNAIKTFAYDTEGLRDYRDLMYICISTHAETLTWLKKSHIPFIIAVPEDKDETIARYIARGNTSDFIAKLDENWDEWIEGLKEYNMPIITVPKGMYLYDILNIPANYKYLLNKQEENIIYNMPDTPTDDESSNPDQSTQSEEQYPDPDPDPIKDYNFEEGNKDN